MPNPQLPDEISGEAMNLDELANEPAEGEALGIVLAPERAFISLGWPAQPVQCSPDELLDMGFSETILEIETDVGGANYGDGCCQICLESDQLDWACT